MAGTERQRPSKRSKLTSINARVAVPAKWLAPRFTPSRNTAASIRRRLRIRVVADEINDEYVPIRAGDYTPSECNGRHIYTINGKEYSECSFCGASCPSRDYFIEPDSGLPAEMRHV